MDEKGPYGIIHGNKGHPSKRTLPFKDQVIRLTKEKYFDFNFTHLSEILEEREHIKVSRETLRLWLRPLGYWRHNKKTTKTQKEKKKE